MMSGRNKCPFTSYQWQELEHQALIFKYMVSGIPIPSHLLLSLKRSFDSSSSSSLFNHQPIGWGSYYEMVGGYGRKIDPEPGRCRRTDGKKWRCSKEAYPDSKYCERHMHRGRNRSRKPVELITSSSSSSISKTTTTTTTNNSPPPPSSSSSSINPSPSVFSSINPTTPSSYSNNLSSQTHPPLCYSYKTNLLPSFHSSFSSDSGSYFQADKDYRYLQGGLREGDDERGVFPGGASGSVRSQHHHHPHPHLYPTTLAMTSSNDPSYYQSLVDKSKEHQEEEQQQHCFIMGADFKSVACSSSRSVEEEGKTGEAKKPFHHFLGEWQPQNNTHTWLDIDHHNHQQQHNHASSISSTTQLSISMPLSTQDLFQSKPTAY